MKYLKCIFIFILSSMFIAGVNAKDLTGKKLNPEDVKEIKQACLDYIEGFYEHSRERVETGMNPSLVKRIIVNGNQIQEMTRDQVVAATVKDVKRTKPDITVKVFDIYQGIASAKIISAYVDYCQLAKIDGKWQIINILWDRLPQKK